MNRLSKGLLGLCLLPALLAGCAASSCDPAAGAAVTVCAGGKPIDFSAEKNAPHKHESGNLYAPVVPLAQALGIPIETDVNTMTVTIGSQKLHMPTTATVKGVHLHDGALFVPLKEFAKAAGLKLDMDFDKGTAGFTK